MKNKFAIIIFLFSTSFIFSQQSKLKVAEQTNIIRDKVDTKPKLLLFDKVETNKAQTEKDLLPKPEIKPFAVYHLKNKVVDSVLIPKPELIPYTGYKKDNN